MGRRAPRAHPGQSCARRCKCRSRCQSAESVKPTGFGFGGASASGTALGNRREWVSGFWLQRGHSHTMVALA